MAAVSEERGTIEIVLPGDRRVRVMGAAVDRRILRDVLWALDDARCGREEAGRC